MANLPRWVERLLAGVRAAAALVAGYAALSLAVRIGLASLRLHAVVPWLRVTLLNSTILLGVSAVLLLWLLRPEAGFDRSQRQRLGMLATLLPLLALTIAALGCKPLASLGILAPYIHADTGRLGFAPRHCYRERRGQSATVTLCTDEHGERAAATAGQGPAQSIVLLGDSFVFGSGVADDHTLASQLARALAATGPQHTWQIDNAGFPGLGFTSYVKQLRSRLPSSRPAVVVLGFNAGNDLDPADTWQRLEQLGDHLVLLSAVLGVEGDLYPLEQADEAVWRDETKIPPAILQRFDDSLVQLLAMQGQYGFRLLIWSYYGPVKLFDNAVAAGHAQVAWPQQVNWSSEPQLHIVGDGHPTAAANYLFAQQLARLIVETPR